MADADDSDPPGAWPACVWCAQRAALPVTGKGDGAEEGGLIAKDAPNPLFRDDVVVVVTLRTDVTDDAADEEAEGAGPPPEPLEVDDPGAPAAPLPTWGSSVSSR